MAEKAAIPAPRQHLDQHQSVMVSSLDHAPNLDEVLSKAVKLFLCCPMKNSPRKTFHNSIKCYNNCSQKQTQKKNKFQNKAIKSTAIVAIPAHISTNISWVLLWIVETQSFEKVCVGGEGKKNHQNKSVFWVHKNHFYQPCPLIQQRVHYLINYLFWSNMCLKLSSYTNTYTHIVTTTQKKADLFPADFDCVRLFSQSSMLLWSKCYQNAIISYQKAIAFPDPFSCVSVHGVRCCIVWVSDVPCCLRGSAHTRIRAHTRTHTHIHRQI